MWIISASGCLFKKKSITMHGNMNTKFLVTTSPGLCWRVRFSDCGGLDYVFQGMDVWNFNEDLTKMHNSFSRVVAWYVTRRRDQGSLTAVVAPLADTSNSLLKTFMNSLTIPLSWHEISPVPPSFAVHVKIHIYLFNQMQLVAVWWVCVLLYSSRHNVNEG
jgi:hypothetical protein